MDRDAIDEYLDDVRRQAVRVAIQAGTLRGMPTATSQRTMLEAAQRLAAEAVHLGDDLRVVKPEVRTRPAWKRGARRLASLLWKLGA